jgi:hypothetical protein
VASDVLAVSYAFNIPSTTFANTGSGGSGLDVTATVAAPAGNPAKNRGVYFDGSSHGFVEIGGLLLAHTFAFHSWVFVKETPYATDLTLFSKDRDDFVPATDRFQLRLSVDGKDNAGKMKAGLAQDIDASNYVEHVSSEAVPNTAWVYLVYSFELTAADTKVVSFYINNAAKGTGTYTGLFHIDHADYKSFIGIDRVDAGPTYGNHWNGFVYDFQIYHKTHNAGSDTTHYDAGCRTAGDCWTDDFMNWLNVDTTAACASPSCDDIGCVRAEVC